MSYTDKIRAQILGAEPIRGDIRRFHFFCLLEIAKEADKEISKLKMRLKNTMAVENSLHEEVADLKSCQAMTEQNFTDYSEQASIWLGENRKEIEAKNKELTKLKSFLTHEGYTKNIMDKILTDKDQS